MYVPIWNNRSNQKALKKYITVFGSVMGLVFIYGVVMYHFAENPEESVRIAGVTVPVSHLLNDDEDVYAIFYTDTFTNENMTNTQDKLAAVADELFIKTKQEAGKSTVDILLVPASDWQEMALIATKTAIVRTVENKSYTWEGFADMLKAYPLAKPKIYVR